MTMKGRFLLWVIGIGLITALTVTAGVDSIIQVIVSIDPLLLLGFLAFMCAFQLFTISLTAYQWFHLMRAEVPSLSLKDVLRIHLAGGFVESVTPSSKLGGEAAKVYLFRKRTGLEYSRITSYLLAHKYFSLLPFLFLCLLLISMASLTYNVPEIVLLSFGFFAILMMGLVVLIHRKPSGKASKSNRMPRLRSATRYVGTAAAEVKGMTDARDRLFLFGISFLVWGLYPVKIYLTAMVLGVELGFGLIVMATFAAYLVSMLPLTPGGLGTFEGSMALILSVNGIPFAAGVAIALMARLFIFWFPLIVSAYAAMSVMAYLDPERDRTASETGKT